MGTPRNNVAYWLAVLLVIQHGSEVSGLKCKVCSENSENDVVSDCETLRECGSRQDVLDNREHFGQISIPFQADEPGEFRCAKSVRELDDDVTMTHRGCVSGPVKELDAQCKAAGVSCYFCTDEAKDDGHDACNAGNQLGAPHFGWVCAVLISLMGLRRNWTLLV